MKHEQVINFRTYLFDQQARETLAVGCVPVDVDNEDSLLSLVPRNAENAMAGIVNMVVGNRRETAGQLSVCLNGDNSTREFVLRDGEWTELT